MGYKYSLSITLIEAQWEDSWVYFMTPLEVTEGSSPRVRRSPGITDRKL